MYCSNCGNQLDAQGVCPNCSQTNGQFNNQMQNQNIVYNQNIVAPKKKSHTGLIIALVIGIPFVLLVIVTLAIFLIGNFIIGVAEKIPDEPTIIIQDPVDSGTQTVFFDSYVIEISDDYLVNIEDDSVTFYDSERSYEFSIIKKEYMTIKTAKDTFVGTSVLGDSTLIIETAKLNTVLGKEMVVLNGTIDDYDTVLLYSTSKVVPNYTVGFMCYGDIEDENAIYSEFLKILNSLKIDDELNN